MSDIRGITGTAGSLIDGAPSGKDVFDEVTSGAVDKSEPVDGVIVSRTAYLRVITRVAHSRSSGVSVSASLSTVDDGTLPTLYCTIGHLLYCHILARSWTGLVYYLV